jgi:hypothetical protein
MLVAVMSTTYPDDRNSPIKPAGLGKGPTRRLLRHKKTRLWYKTGGAWTGDMKEAASFPSAASTVAVCKDQKLQDVQMVLAFGETIYGIAIDIHAGGDESRTVTC